MKKLIALLTLATLPVIGLAGVAHAQDQPWGPGADGLVHFDDGTCYQPMSNPPAHVPCASTRATTPYVSGERFDDDTVSTAPPDTIVPEAASAPVIPTPKAKKPATKVTHSAAVDAPVFVEMLPFVEL